MQSERSRRKPSASADTHHELKLLPAAWEARNGVFFQGSGSSLFGDFKGHIMEPFVTSTAEVAALAAKGTPTLAI
jgi:hypothetical protein